MSIVGFKAQNHPQQTGARGAKDSGLPDHSAQLRHLAAALTELVHHGDLTPAGKRKLEQILGGEQ